MDRGAAIQESNLGFQKWLPRSKKTCEHEYFQISLIALVRGGQVHILDMFRLSRHHVGNLWKTIAQYAVIEMFEKGLS